MLRDSNSLKVWPQSDRISSSVNAYARKFGFVERLAYKMPFRAEHPNRCSQGNETTVKIAIDTKATVRTRRSDSLICCSRVIDFDETARAKRFSGYVSEMKHVVLLRRRVRLATRIAAPMQSETVVHADSGHHRQSGILPKRSPALSSGG